MWWTVIPESCSAIIVLFCDFEFGENFLQIPQFQALNWWSDAVFETYCGEETHAFNNLIQILNWIALFSVPGAKTTLTGEKNVEEEKMQSGSWCYLVYLNAENSLFINHRLHYLTKAKLTVLELIVVWWSCQRNFAKVFTIFIEGWNWKFVLEVNHWMKGTLGSKDHKRRSSTINFSDKWTHHVSTMFRHSVSALVDSWGLVGASSENIVKCRWRTSGLDYPWAPESVVNERAGKLTGFRDQAWCAVFL